MNGLCGCCCFDGDGVCVRMMDVEGWMVGVCVVCVCNVLKCVSVGGEWDVVDVGWRGW